MMNNSNLHFNRSNSPRVARWLMSLAGCIATATLIQSCCEISAASDAEALAGSNLDSCSANHAQGQMSVVVSSKVARVSNGFLLETWNGAMKSFVNPKVLSLKSVDSATGDADTVRFLQLDGKYGKGLGVGSRVLNTLFKEGGKGSGLLGSGTISNIQEALEVKSPDINATNRFKKISAFVGMEDFLSMQRPDGALSLYADYEASEQWAPAQTHYDSAFDDLKAAALAANPTKTVRVAVLDTGIDINHPDLKDIIDRDLAYNALTGKAGADQVGDQQGHGTHVAGIIAGQGKGKGPGVFTNVLGVAGKFNVKIVPIKVLGDDGTGSTAAMNRGIRWATQKNVDVISMSLGSGSNYDCLRDQGLKDPVIQEAIDKGIIVVAAAGNESCPLGGECATAGAKFKNYTVLPCAAENVLCVASNDFEEKASKFSNFKSATDGADAYRVAPDITAPGSRILSTYPTIPKFADYEGVAVLDGTSMATPYVSGIAAILKLTETADYPVNQKTLKIYLQEASYKSDDYATNFGVGRVDLKALVDNRKNKYINKNTGTAAPGVRNAVPYTH